MDLCTNLVSVVTYVSKVRSLTTHYIFRPVHWKCSIYIQSAESSTSACLFDNTASIAPSCQLHVWPGPSKNVFLALCKSCDLCQLAVRPGEDDESANLGLWLLGVDDPGADNVVHRVVVAHLARRDADNKMVKYNLYRLECVLRGAL